MLHMKTYLSKTCDIQTTLVDLQKCQTYFDVLVRSHKISDNGTSLMDGSVCTGPIKVDRKTWAVTTIYNYTVSIYAVLDGGHCLIANGFTATDRPDTYTVECLSVGYHDGRTDRSARFTDLCFTFHDGETSYVSFDTAERWNWHH